MLFRSNSVTYTLDAGAGFSGFLWNNGATTQTIIADTNGIYCVVVTDLNSCSDSDCVQIQLDAAGLESISGQDPFLLYPNPAHNTLTVFLRKENAASGCELRIYNALGSVVGFRQLTSETETIAVSEYQRGIYTAEILTEDRITRRKLILY